MIESRKCGACGYIKWHSDYESAEPAWRFLWWRSDGHSARLRLQCMACGFTEYVEPGSVQARL